MRSQSLRSCGGRFEIGRHTEGNGAETVMASERPQISPGRRYGQIGKYEIVAHLASGGMCVVYRAVDPGLGREVALKVLPPELANQTILLERFRREARNVAKLRHENIVTIYEFGEANGVNYLALEY